MGCASILLTVCDARGGVLMMMCKEPNDLSIFAKDSCGEWVRCTGPAGLTHPRPTHQVGRDQFP